MQQSTVKRAIKKHINLPNVEELFVSIANASLAGTLITMADGAILLLSYQLSPDLHSLLLTNNSVMKFSNIIVKYFSLCQEPKYRLLERFHPQRLRASYFGRTK